LTFWNQFSEAPRFPNYGPIFSDVCVIEKIIVGIVGYRSRINGVLYRHM